MKKTNNQPKQPKSTSKVKTATSYQWTWYVLGIISFITFAIYFKATKFDLLYNWDDRGYITDDIKGLHWENIKLFFTGFYVGNYQPITMLLYAIEYKLGAGKISIYHLTNILLHIINTYLVFQLIKRISPQNIAVALITAAFFAVHPMHVESVAWVSERKDVLYSFFFLLSLIMYSDYLKFQQLKHLLLTGVFFTLSCLSKSAAVILPLVMLLMDYYLNRKFSWKIIVEKIPFFAISLIIGLVAIKSQERAIEVMAARMSILEHISVVTYSFISYVFKAFIPINLSAIYPYPTELGTTLPLIYYLSILFVGLLLFFVWYSRKWGNDIVFGFLFFVITIVLVLQFVQVGAATMADRYTYIPYIGVFFVIGKLYERLSQHVNVNFAQYKKLLSTIIVSGFIIFSVITYNRVQIWENDITLFSDVIKKYPNTNSPYINRALYYLKFYGENPNLNNIQREFYIKEAIVDFENSLTKRLNTSDSAKVYYSLGTAKYYLGDLAGAINYFDKTIEVDASYISAYNNRGSAKFTLKNYEGALVDFNKVIELNPTDVTAYFNRGKTKNELKNFNGAVEDFNNVPETDKNYVYACFNKAIIKNQLNDYNGVITELDKAIKIEPTNWNYYSVRGFAKHMLKDYKGALEDYNRAVELNPQDSNSINNRALVNQLLKSTT